MLPPSSPADSRPTKCDGIPSGRSSTRDIICIVGIGKGLKEAARFVSLSKADATVNSTFDKSKEMLNHNDMFGPKAIGELSQG